VDHAKPRGRSLLVLVVALLVIAVDQLTKTLALHHLSKVVDGSRLYTPHHIVGSLYLELTFNSGAAFGLGQGVTPIVETVVVVLVVCLIIFGRRAARHSTLPDAIGLGLLVGGALGNLCDRLFRDHGGGVIDFINIAEVNGHEYWPVFNAADSAIVVGALLLALQYSRTSSRRARLAPRVVAPPGGAPSASRPQEP
jgi:signal peptidase II